MIISKLPLGMPNTCVSVSVVDFKNIFLAPLVSLAPFIYIFHGAPPHDIIAPPKTKDEDNFHWVQGQCNFLAAFQYVAIFLLKYAVKKEVQEQRGICRQ